MSLLGLSKERILLGAFFCAISAHLVAELVRRFFFFSNVVYLVSDVLVITFSFYLQRKNSSRFNKIIGAFIFSYVFLGLASLLFSGQNGLLWFVGVRPILLSCACYFVAEKFFCLNKYASKIFHKIILLWSGIILFVAIVQIFAGSSAPINSLPEAMNAEFGGRGDYMSSSGGLAWLFRPTSIFMHTGRLGQYSFFLGLVLILPVLLERNIPKKCWVGAACAVLLVLVSGQRAAGVFLAGSCALTLFLFASKKTLFRTVLSSLALVLFFLVISAELRSVVVGRFASGFTDGVDRAIEMTQYWDVGFSRYPVFGNGLGFFSFGGRPFGGQIYYEYMQAFGGGGENSWLRIQGETGIPGLFLFACIVALITVKSYKRARLARGAPECSIHLASALLALFSSLWAFTHDVYGNYLFLMPMFLLFGASSGLAKKHLATRKVDSRQSFFPDASAPLNVTEATRFRGGVGK